MAMERLDFLVDEVVSGLLADQHQQLANGLVNDLPMLGFVDPDQARHRVGVLLELQVAHGALDQLGGDLASAGQLDSLFPGALGWGQGSNRLRMFSRSGFS